MVEDHSFRKNVAAIFSDANGNVLAFRRADVEEEAWQFPQGGVDGDEKPEEALRRELSEELGLTPDKYSIIGTTDRWYSYELPREYRSAKIPRGQIQKWFHCRLQVPDEDIHLDDVEFNDMKWFEPREIASRVVQFRRRTYRRVMQEFGLL